MPRRAASGGHGTLHPDDDTAPPIRGPRRAGHRAAGRRMRLLDPDPQPDRRAERVAPSERAVRGVGPTPRARRPRRPPRRPPVRPGRRRRPSRRPPTRTTRTPPSTRRSRARSAQLRGHHGDQARRARRVRQGRPVRLHHLELREGQPGGARHAAPRRCTRRSALMPQDAVAARPVHRAAHEPGRRPVRRRDQEDVRRHEHGRDRPGREDHVRPRVHARAPGPAVHACVTSSATRRTRATGRSPGRRSSRATRRCSCRSGRSSTSRPRSSAQVGDGRRPGLGGGPRQDARDPQGRAPVPVHERAHDDARRVPAGRRLRRAWTSLFANPPDSTEQVIHADKLAAREPAVAVAFPDDLAGLRSARAGRSRSRTRSASSSSRILLARRGRRGARRRRRGRLGRRPRRAGSRARTARTRRSSTRVGHGRRRGRVRGGARGYVAKLEAAGRSRRGPHAGPGSRSS